MVLNRMLLVRRLGRLTSRPSVNRGSQQCTLHMWMCFCAVHFKWHPSNPLNVFALQRKTQSYTTVNSSLKAWREVQNFTPLTRTRVEGKSSNEDSCSRDNWKERVQGDFLSLPVASLGQQVETNLPQNNGTESKSNFPQQDGIGSESKSPQWYTDSKKIIRGCNHSLLYPNPNKKVLVT